MISKRRLVSNILLIVFWVMGTYAFVIDETLGGSPGAELAVRLAAQAVLIILGTLLLRSRIDIAILGTFCAITFYSTCLVHHYPLFTWVDGLRMYVPFLFILPILRYILTLEKSRRYFVALFDRSLLIFLWLQFPCIILQTLLYSNPDMRGGSLGWMCSGEVTTLIYVISFYLMLRHWDYSRSYFSNVGQHWIYLFLWLPSLMNETKISFVFIALYLLLLIPMDRQYAKRLIYILPILAAFMGLAYVVYSSSISSSSLNKEGSLAFYMIGDEFFLDKIEKAEERGLLDIDDDDMPRGLKLIATPALMDRNEHTWPWGFGLGQVKSGDAADKTLLGRYYNWLIKGTKMQLHMFWLEAGLVGVAWYILYWLAVFRSFRHLHPGQRNRQLTWMLALTVALVSFYNSLLFNIPFAIVSLYFIFFTSRWRELPSASCAGGQALEGAGQ